MDILSLLAWKDAVVINKISLTANRITLGLSTIASTVRCPKCGRLSSRVHSRYERMIADLPWAGKRVNVILRVHRFFCDNEKCSRRTFAEPLQTVPRYGRRTERMQHQLTQLAGQLGGRPGAKLATLLGMPVSFRTLLRMLYRLDDQPVTTPKVLGVDDWSIKKGTTYATILVDIEKQRPIELLLGREADTLSSWLDQHPGVEVITRDRASSYAVGATQGAPDAIQVADRWHLLKNLSEALKRMLEKHTVQLRVSARQLAEQQQEIKHQEVASAEIGGPSTTLSSPMATYALRFREVKKLLNEGHGVRTVARMLQMSKNTVKRYRNLEQYPAKTSARRPSTVLPWKAHLIKRWNEGERNQRQLWREIREQGFTGSPVSVHRFFAHFPKEGKAISLPELEVKNWSPTKVQFLLSKPKDKLNEEERAFLKIFFSHFPQAELARTLALKFHAIFREKRANDLPSWIEQAKISGISALKNFATGLESDYAAVEAAATYQWSNGPVEGHVNRLKTIKREMYGRAGFNLLRKRVLFYPDTS